MHGVIAALVAVPFAVGFLVGPADDRDDDDGDVVFAFTDPEIVESSGLVAREGLFVTVNDSGDGGRVFTVDPDSGDTVGTTTWDESPTDVEAVAPAEDGEVWVGDIGDNLQVRDGIRLHRVAVGPGDLSGTAASYDLVYPNGAHDAESLLVHPETGQVFVAAKEFIGGFYAAPEELSESGTNRLKKLGDVAYSTDGAFFPGGEHVVLRDYGSATVYTFPGLDVVGEFELPDQEQGEGIAVDEEGEVYVSSEGEYAEVLHVELPGEVRAAVDGTTPQGDPGEGTTDAPADGSTDGSRRQPRGRRVRRGRRRTLMVALGPRWRGGRRDPRRPAPLPPPPLTRSAPLCLPRVSSRLVSTRAGSRVWACRDAPGRRSGRAEMRRVDGLGVQRCAGSVSARGGTMRQVAGKSYEFEAALWQWRARDAEPGSWFFVSLPQDVSDEIEATTEPHGFGSVRVEVTIGACTWRTSIFPSAEEKTFVLPVKKPVRRAEGLDGGDTCRVTLQTL